MRIEGDDMRAKSYSAVVMGMAFLTGVAGCSGGDGIAAIDRSATSEDQLPSYVSTESLDVDSVRLVAEHDGIAYFISRPADGSGFCVIRIPDRIQTVWAAACGQGGNVVSTSSIGISQSVTLVTDGYSTSDLEKVGWEKITDNLLVR